MDAIGQIVQLVKGMELWCGESDEQLWRYYLQKQERGELLYVEQWGQIVGFVEFDWIRHLKDIVRSEQGEAVTGPILFVGNAAMVGKRKNILFKLWKKGPPHRWIAWTEWLNKEGTRRRLHLPKGSPWKEYSHLSVVEFPVS